MKSILHNVLRVEADIAESERISVAMIAADIEEYRIILMDAVMPTRVRHWTKHHNTYLNKFLCLLILMLYDTTSLSSCRVARKQSQQFAKEVISI